MRKGSVGVVLRANRAIGSGHLMRVLPLMRCLKERGLALSLFAYAFEKSLSALCSVFDSTEIFDTAGDLALSLASRRNLPDLLILDDYALSRDFEEPLHRRTAVMVIDDLANRAHDCDLLLDTDLMCDGKAAAYERLCPKGCRFLLGSAYALTDLRFYPAFFERASPRCDCAAHRGPYSARALKDADAKDGSCLAQDSVAHPRPRALVCFGGADPVSATLTLTRTIVSSALYRDFDFTIVSGMANTDNDAIMREIRSLKTGGEGSKVSDVREGSECGITQVRSCSDMADLMYRHDVAIGAYGGMLKERIITGIPSAGVQIADNQKGADALCARLELGLTLSLADLADERSVRSALALLLENGEKFTRNCMRLYDGKGLFRIADAVEELALCGR